MNPQRKNKLMKISKVTAFKALGCIRSKPECVFAMLCNAEVSDRSDKESTEVKSARLAFTKTASSLHSKKKKRFLQSLQLIILCRIFGIFWDLKSHNTCTLRLACLQKPLEELQIPLHEDLSYVLTKEEL